MFVCKIVEKFYCFMYYYVSGDMLMVSILGIFYGLSGRYIDVVLNEKISLLFMIVFKKYGY